LSRRFASLASWRLAPLRSGSVPITILNQKRSYASRPSQQFEFMSQQTIIPSPMTRVNTLINFVAHQEVWIIELFGKYNRTVGSGLKIILPFIEKVAYVHSLKEQVIDVHPQHAITRDNVSVQMDGNVFIQVVDPLKASYNVSDPLLAVIQLAQSTMRNEVGKLDLDELFSRRELLNSSIGEALQKATDPWGIVCLRYEIRNIVPPREVQESMNRQANAERIKREDILTSEGVRQRFINEAEGRKQSQILSSEAVMQSNINNAKGEAEAIELQAKAVSRACSRIAEEVFGNNEGAGEKAAKYLLAIEWVKQYGNIVGKSNTVVMNDSLNDVNQMVGRAMSLIGSVKFEPEEKKRID